MKPSVILSWKSCPVWLYSFLPKALASLHFFAYSSNRREYGIHPKVVLCLVAGRKKHLLFSRNSSSSQSSSAHQGRIWPQFIFSVYTVAVWKVWDFSHICARFKQSTSQAVFSPQCHWAYELAAQQKIWFLFTPLSAGLIHSWPFRLREINQVVPGGFHLFGKSWKDQNPCH